MTRHIYMDCLRDGQGDAQAVHCNARTCSLNACVCCVLVSARLYVVCLEGERFAHQIFWPKGFVSSSFIFYMICKA